MRTLFAFLEKHYISPVQHIEKELYDPVPCKYSVLILPRYST
jgi:hypothetical protein